MIRQTTLFALALATGLNAASALADEPLTGCAAKRLELQEKIETARQHGNSRQQAGLEEALSQLEANCDDDSLRKERLSKVEEARQEVMEREMDLRDAMAKGDPDKVAKRQAKLAESRAELEQAEAELKR